jgi:hypothetical protein
MPGSPTNYTGTLGQGMSLSIAGPSGTPASFSLLDILSGKPPDRNYKQAKYTPQTGDKAGKEQVLVGSEEATECEVTVVYSSAVRNGIEAFKGINGCTITFTTPPPAGATTGGGSFAGTGALVKITGKKVGDTEIFEDTLTFAICGGWAYSGS